MTIVWRQAVCDGFGLFIALAGGSTSGKTYTALRLARGIAGPGGRIAVLDTEGGRTSHYAPEFHFFEHRMQEPFTPPRFAEAAKSAEENGFACLVIDNFSLEWMGPGGVLDQHDKLLTRKYGDNEAKRMAGAQAAWGKVKPPHKAMMTAFLQLRMPIIFVLRAEEKTKPDANGVPKNLGWMPLQDGRFIYEWTVSFTLHPETPGKPRYDLPHKVEGQHRKLFPDGELIGEKAGAALWAWASSGISKDATRPTPPASTPPPAAEPEPAPPPSAPTAQLFTEDDGFPEEVMPVTMTAAQAKAREFADELLGAVQVLTTRDAINRLLNQAAVRKKMARLSEAHPEIHRKLASSINSHITDVSLAAA